MHSGRRGWYTLEIISIDPKAPTLLLNEMRVPSLRNDNTVIGIETLASNAGTLLYFWAVVFRFFFRKSIKSDEQFGSRSDPDPEPDLDTNCLQMLSADDISRP